MLKKLALVLTLTLSGLMWQCGITGTSSTEEQYSYYCGSCHMAPDPSLLSWDLWQENVLPEMAARLGVKVGDYDPLQGLGLEEQYYIELLGTYPGEPLISQEDWDAICVYIEENAADSLKIDRSRAHRNDSLSQFALRQINTDSLPGADVTAIHYSDEDATWIIGNKRGQIFQLDQGEVVEGGQLSSAISGFAKKDDAIIVLEMGIIGPTDIPMGKMWHFADSKELIRDRLFRPVHINTARSGAELPGMILCEYGNRAGRLSLVRKVSEEWELQPLMEVPGVIKTEVVDMDDDGHEDLVVLAAQGDESMYLLSGDGAGEFDTKRLIQLPPVYGISWFELLDYDEDGDLDIVVVCGDNADKTFVLKPYHGLRLFLNNGEEHFSEALFYPIYGATRVLAADFDQDRDYDFAVTAMFPDFENNPEESFIYLENMDRDRFEYQGYTHRELSGQWLVMDKGDFEGDGDTDIILGSYLDSPAPVPPEMRRDWIEANVDLVILENRTK